MRLFIDKRMIQSMNLNWIELIRWCIIIIFNRTIYHFLCGRVDSISLSLEHHRHSHFIARFKIILIYGVISITIVFFFSLFFNDLNQLHFIIHLPSFIFNPFSVFFYAILKMWVIFPNSLSRWNSTIWNFNVEISIIDLNSTCTLFILHIISLMKMI